jgi:predicted O-methyltransferase YrrM
MGQYLRYLRGSRVSHTDARAVATHPRGDDGIDYYDGIVIGPDTIGELASSDRIRQDVLADLDLLSQDDYARYLRQFLVTGDRVSDSWRYADICTVLAAAAELLQPASYLEIGVRRGRSMAIVGRRAPECALLGIDLWIEGYAGMDNPGPAFVREELQKIGHRGDVELLSGDSHTLLPALFSQRSSLAFDLVAVDGDHSRRGAAADLRTVLPRLKVGGAVVFDDVGHPSHPELAGVWQREVAEDRRYATWSFDSVGYGVAVAVRRW